MKRSPSPYRDSRRMIVLRGHPVGAPRLVGALLRACLTIPARAGEMDATASRIDTI